MRFQTKQSINHYTTRAREYIRLPRLLCIARCSMMPFGIIGRAHDAAMHSFQLTKLVCVCDGVMNNGKTRGGGGNATSNYKTLYHLYIFIYIKWLSPTDRQRVIAGAPSQRRSAHCSNHYTTSLFAPTATEAYCTTRHDGIDF